MQYRKTASFFVQFHYIIQQYLQNELFSFCRRKAANEGIGYG